MKNAGSVYNVTGGVLGITSTDMDGGTVAVTAPVTAQRQHIPVSAYRGRVDALTLHGAHDLCSRALLGNLWRPMDMNFLVPVQTVPSVPRGAQ